MNGASIVDDLARTVDDTLRTLIPAGERCALIDFPDHPNVGDSAIWLGERAFLRRRGAAVIYTCSARTYSEGELRSRLGSGLILIHGGGNLGDLWTDHEELREQVVRAFPHNRIIQLPQTIWFQTGGNLARARAVFDGHPNLTILARDQRSLAFARNEFRATSLLCPDAAFALGRMQRPVTPDHDIVCLLRSDIESTLPAISRTDAVDWLEDRQSLRLTINRWCYRHRTIAFSWRMPLVRQLHDGLWDGLARERVRRGCLMLSRGQVVITDRLHGHILSLLLGIEHVVLDNSYGKLSDFFQSWTRGSRMTHWAQSLEEATRVAGDLVSRSPQPRA